MDARARGFTLIELLLVSSILAILAVIALPNILSSRLSANEAAVIGTLKTLHSAQANFQQRGVVDRDGDGVGEYGGFRELSGAVPPRVGAGDPPKPRLDPPMMGLGFRTLGAPWGHVDVSGYYLQIYLPLPNGNRYPELVTGEFNAALDLKLSESVWCCYAWPKAYGQSGRRTFCVNQTGVIVATDAPTYSGPANGDNRPESVAATQGAAFARNNPVLHTKRITGRLASGEPGYDGNIWRRIQ